MNPWPPIKQFLRRPAIIHGEIALLAAAGALGAVFPERHLFSSIGFAAITSLAAASLVVVLIDQFHRVRLQWRQPLTPAHFSSAPFKTEFERPASGAGTPSKFWSERRAGLAGSLVFHAGLLLLIGAGVARALFVREAATDLLEGETLPARYAWSAQWPGVFGKNFSLDQPVTLESVRGARYADGNLRELRAKCSAGEIALNHGVEFGGGNLYLAQEFGPAALLEWNATRRDAVLLTDEGAGNYSAAAAGPDGLKVFLHARGERPAGFDVRLMRGDALVVAGLLGTGRSLALPDGSRLTLRGAPMWARLHGSRDSALGFAYFGMLLTMIGAAMMFCLIPRDLCIVITPSGEREKVFIALKPRRFAPLFQEQFEKIVREESDLRGGASAACRPVEPDPTPAVLCRQAVTLLLLGMAIVSSAGCDRVSSSQARKLVERYNQVVAEAYRRGDVKLIDPVVGPKEGARLAGLIGVRLDLGITLDSRLLKLEITGVEPARAQLRVRTREQWTYRDLKIGTGEQVGQASQDFYEMTYVFTNVNRAWLVDEIQFASLPQVGRTTTPWVAERSAMHGTTLSNVPEGKP